MTLWCLKCGEPFDPNETICLGRWTLGPDWATIDGQRLAISAGEAKVLYAVAQGKGRPVRRSFIAEFATDNEPDWPLNGLAVRTHHLRAKLGAAYPIAMRRRVGLSWCDPLFGTEPGTPHGAVLEEGK
ncbi:MAG: hypothetical protein CL820_12055 [Croceicoccus sp.]|nr:hypothetical protein [Croceicoccus sp.]MAL26603.1 hypothetical protein [Croceicoccus sp.]